MGNIAFFLFCLVLFFLDFIIYIVYYIFIEYTPFPCALVHCNALCYVWKTTICIRVLLTAGEGFFLNLGTLIQVALIKHCYISKSRGLFN